MKLCDLNIDFTKAYEASKLRFIMLKSYELPNQ